MERGGGVALATESDRSFNDGCSSQATGVCALMNTDLK